MFYDLYSGTPQCIHIHSIVNSLVSCNVGKIPETWSVRRMKYTYYIYIIYIHIIIPHQHPPARVLKYKGHGYATFHQP